MKFVIRITRILFQIHIKSTMIPLYCEWKWTFCRWCDNLLSFRTRLPIRTIIFAFFMREVSRYCIDLVMGTATDFLNVLPRVPQNNLWLFRDQLPSWLFPESTDPLEIIGLPISYAVISMSLYSLIQTNWSMMSPPSSPSSRHHW